MNKQNQLLLDLIRTPGEPCREQEISDTIRQLVLDAGVPASGIRTDDAHKKSMYGGETGNLYVDIPGTGQGDRVMLSTHMDTIPIALGSNPVIQEGRIVDDRAEGSLGGDARAGCAILIHAIRKAMELNGNHSPVSFVFFVQEELGLVGSANMNPEMAGTPGPVMCFNFDGASPNEIESLITGAERMMINISGVCAHSGRPHLGISAAAIEARAFSRLVEDGWHGVVDKQGESGTANLGVLKGGKGSNQVMPDLYCLAEARSFDHDFRKKIIRQWKDAFTEAVDFFNQQTDVSEAASVKFSPGPVYEAVNLGADTPVVTAARKALHACGVKSKLKKDMGGQDVNNINAVGIPAVGVGCGCHNPHAPDEYVDISEFNTSCRMAEILVTRQWE